MLPFILLTKYSNWYQSRTWEVEDLAFYARTWSHRKFGIYSSWFDSDHNAENGVEWGFLKERSGESSHVNEEQSRIQGADYSEVLLLESKTRIGTALIPGEVMSRMFRIQSMKEKVWFAAQPAQVPVGWSSLDCGWRVPSRLRRN
jgi:hypothetical protein